MAEPIQDGAGFFNVGDIVTFGSDPQQYEVVYVPKAGLVEGTTFKLVRK
jgi:hypothetical protein